MNIFRSKYDYLVVGAGFFGAVFARAMAEKGKKVLIVEKSRYIGGLAYTKEVDGILAHVHGPHLFNTNNKQVWDYVNKFAEFDQYQHKVKARNQGKIYSLPFNMNTFYEMWGVTTPGEARQKIKQQRVKIENPKNLEEWALSQIGPDLYHGLVYGYSKKQWGREPKRLPKFILQRIPLRFTWNDSYHEKRYRGLPVKGYTHLIENIIDGIEIKLNTDFFEIQNWKKLAKRLVFSGSIDDLFQHKYGPLEYRSLEHKTTVVDGDHQGISQMNYPDPNVPYTRIIEHKHFRFKELPKSIISFEYPKEWEKSLRRFYPLRDARNIELYKKYLSEMKDNCVIGGRLGSFCYLNMDATILQAAVLAEKEK
jgi:UDP-galactopyranose mutase